MKNIFFFLLLAGALSPSMALAIVDTRSAGYSKNFVDFRREGPGFPLTIERTYNSRSLFNGLFGYGWCSNLETKLSVLPDNSIKIVECGGGMEIVYHPKGQVPNDRRVVNDILKGIRSKRKVKMSEKALKELEGHLYQSPHLRADFIKALGLAGQAKSGLKYYARGRFTEYVTAHAEGYTRILPNGRKERFDKEGRLTRIYGRQGRIDISWGQKAIKLMDESGRRLVLTLNPKNGKIQTAKYNGKVVASYTHRGENLVKAVNSYNETFRHEYDSLHNLTKTVYPDKTVERLEYNKNKDWVIAFTDRRGCRESYGFGVNKSNPNHYFSTVKKVCKKKVVHKSKYEFWHKTRKGGGKYLHRARARVNGRLKTDVTYHPVFGAPLNFFKDGVRTLRKYYGNGLLRKKDNKYKSVEYSRYNQKCRKPELVNVAYKNPNSGDDKVMRREKIEFSFDSGCRLTQARKSPDEWIKVRHDGKDRIISMEDQSMKKISLVWHKKFNKPERIIREGVGAIRIVYDKKGDFQGVRGLEKGPTVIAQVTSVFNSFLTVLAPVEEEMVIL